MRAFAIALALIGVGFLMGWLAARGRDGPGPVRAERSARGGAASRVPARPGAGALPAQGRAPGEGVPAGGAGPSGPPSPGTDDGPVPGFRFGFLVVDARWPGRREPVEAWVEWLDPHGERERLGAQAVEDGRARYRLLAGEYFVGWEDPGAGVARHRRVALRAGETIRVRVVDVAEADAVAIRPGFGRLEARVFDLAGRAVEGAPVYLARRAPDGDPWWETFSSDPRGVAVAELAPGRYSVGLGSSATRPVALVAGEVVSVDLVPRGTGEVVLARRPHGSLRLEPLGREVAGPQTSALQAGPGRPARFLAVAPGVHRLLLRPTGERGTRELGRVVVRADEVSTVELRLSGVDLDLAFEGAWQLGRRFREPPVLTPLTDGSDVPRTAAPRTRRRGDGTSIARIIVYDLEPGRWRVTWAPRGFEPVDEVFFVDRRTNEPVRVTFDVVAER